MSTMQYAPKATDKFQGLCLENSVWHKWMKTFDRFGPQVRQRLRDSPYNICAACVRDTVVYHPGYRGDNSDDLALKVISEMEAAIRAATPPEDRLPCQ